MRWREALASALIYGTACSALLISACNRDGAGEPSLAQSTCEFEIASVPFTATEPGAYCFAGDLDATQIAQDAIVVDSEGIRIDGRGHWLRGPEDAGTPHRGIIAYDRSGLSIENLSIRGFHTAILVARTDAMDEDGRYIDAKSRDIHIDHVHVEKQRLQGIHVRADKVTIANASVQDVGGSTTTPHAFATGIAVTGNECMIYDNKISEVRSVGSGEGVGIALYGGLECEVRRNEIAFSEIPEWGENYGLWINTSGRSPPVVEANQVAGAAFVAGPFGQYKSNVGKQILCDLFIRRPTTGTNLIDDGGNVVASWSMDKVCKDDPDAMARLYRGDPGPEAAYAVARAWSEVTADNMVEGQDSARAIFQSYVWLRVAAHLGHELAVAAIKDSEWVAYARTFDETVSAAVDSILAGKS